MQDVLNTTLSNKDITNIPLLLRYLYSIYTHFIFCLQFSPPQLFLSPFAFRRYIEHHPLLQERR